MHEVVQAARHAQIGRKCPLHLPRVSLQIWDGSREVGCQMPRGGRAAPDRGVNAFASERIEEARRIADQQNVPRHHRRTRSSHRQMVPPQAMQARRVDAAPFRQTRQPRAQIGRRIYPPADADVEVIAAGKDPAVATWGAADVEGNNSRPARRQPIWHGYRGLKRQAHPAGHGQARQPRSGPPHAIGDDERPSLHRAPVRMHHDTGRKTLDPAHHRALPHFCAGRRGSFNEKGIEAAALRHIDQRLRRVPHERAVTAQAEANAEGNAFEDRGEVKGQQPGRTDVHAPATGLVPGKRRAVQQQHFQATRRTLPRGSAPRWTRSRDDDVKAHEGEYAAGPGRSLITTRHYRGGIVVKVTVAWQPPKRFEATAESGANMLMDARLDSGGGGAGPSPMETVLAALAGCTGSDVTEILRKMRAPLEGLTISVEAERAVEHPRMFTKIHLRYAAWGAGLARDQVERAVTLSQEKYCPVSAMLSRAAAITHELVVSERPQTVA